MFAFYLVVVGLLDRIRTLQKDLEERVSQRTGALTREIEQRLRLQKELLEISEREQRRIGHDLHDSLCQHLTGTALAGHCLGQKLADKSLPETAEANRLVELVEEAIELTRTLAHSLHPIEIQAGRLTDNFQELANGASERFKVACNFECEKVAPLFDVNTATHLYRIVQEAITNAVRHGHAKHINICLDFANHEIVLTVTDDGVGLPENARNKDGMGLRIMAYRADMIGATFNIERLPATGTRITCIVPHASVSNENHAAKN
jgi:signal transduction histidine kinase